MEKFDVIALGELLVDFASKGVGEAGRQIYEANPGGAPCNVLSMLQKLGDTTAFIGKVGKDAFGDMLATALENENINIDNLSRDNHIPTTLAFVSNDASGDRNFTFYRNPGADMMLRKEDIDLSVFENASIFHFGTLSMTEPEIEKTTKEMIAYAKERGMLISFDPNLRPLLWDSMEHAKEKMEYGLSVCDIFKISDNEIEFLTGNTDIRMGMKQLVEKYQPKVACATMGRDGSIAFYKQYEVEAKAYLQPNTVDTTGAGDTFMACILHYILTNGLQNLTEMDLKNMLSFANAAASIITTRVGALSVMPTKEEVEKLISDSL